MSDEAGELKFPDGWVHLAGCVLLAILSDACSATEAHVSGVMVPDEARSAVVAVRYSDATTVSAHADAYAPLRALAHPGATGVVVLFYQNSLAALGLAEAEVQPRVDCARDCALAAPVSAWRVDLEDDDAPEQLTLEHSEVDEVLDVLLPDRALRCTAKCLEFSSRFVQVEPTTPVRSVVSLPDGRAVGLWESGEALLLHVDGTVSPGCTLPTGRVPSTSWWDPAGQLWVALDDGSMVVIEQSALESSGMCSFVRDDAVSSGDFIIHLAGPTEAGVPFELFALTDGRAFLRFDGLSWSELGRLAGEGSSNPRDRRASGGALWLAPSRGVAFQHSLELLYFDGARTRSFEAPPLLGALRVLGGSSSREHGVLLSLESAGVVGAPGVDGPWTTVAAFSADRLVKIVEFEGNLIFGFRSQIAAYQPLRGVCGGLATRNRRGTRLITPFLGTSTLLVADFEDDFDPNGSMVLLADSKTACME